MGLLSALNAFRGTPITFFSEREATLARKILENNGIGCSGIDCSVVTEFASAYIGAVFTFFVAWGKYNQACDLLREAGIL
jgi:hypothetical protein